MEKTQDNLWLHIAPWLPQLNKETRSILWKEIWEILPPSQIKALTIRYDFETGDIQNSYAQTGAEFSITGSAAQEKVKKALRQLKQPYIQHILKAHANEATQKQVGIDEPIITTGAIIRAYRPTSINDLPFSVRARNGLINMSISTIEQLNAKTPRELLRTKNLGKKTLAEITRVLTTIGTSLKTPSHQTREQREIGPSTTPVSVRTYISQSTGQMCTLILATQQYHLSAVALLIYAEQGTLIKTPTHVTFKGARIDKVITKAEQYIKEQIFSDFAESITKDSEIAFAGKGLR